MKRSAPLKRKAVEVSAFSTLTLKAKQCDVCLKDYFPSRPMQAVCSGRCAARKVKLAKEAERARDAERREKLKGHREWIAEAQVAVNRYVRLRDMGKPCISCGATPEQKRGGTMDAGHYLSRGSAPALRFLTTQIAGQCVSCNRYGSGKQAWFREGLIERIGLEAVESIEARKNEVRKFSVDYLKRLKAVFNRKANRLQKRKLG